MVQYKYPVIPESITVHLGLPNSNGENIEVPFIDYIKNVASSEIYPTWPENAIRANVYAQISYALNRIYTEWYPSQGYDFDITNTTQFDQAYQPGRSIEENISRIVDELFNDYVRKIDSVEPFFTQYCNGTTSTCPGLSQWGTVSLAEQGLTPIEILQYYFGDDIIIITNAPVENIGESYPGVPLKLGMAGNDIKLIQSQLNRIRRNFPAIPHITYTDGVYGVETENAVSTFQSIFQLTPTGVIDKATWYEIKKKYNAVKKLSNLNSEGIQAIEIAPVVVTELVPGIVSNEVKTLQYYLSVIGYFVDFIPIIGIDGTYGSQTEYAVKQFQELLKLPVTGIVDARTWDTLRDVYNQVITSLPETFFSNRARIYPGYVLQLGMRNDDVRDLQIYLQAVTSTYPQIPPVEVTGYFDERTKEAVKVFQQLSNLPAEGSVGAATWNQLALAYDKLL